MVRRSVLVASRWLMRQDAPMNHWTVETEVPAGALRVWLDDLIDDRAAPPGWVHVTTAPAAIGLIDRGGVIELSLDHDLGDDEGAGKGVDVVDHIAQQQVVAGRDLWPRDGITIHSANPAGRDQMARTIKRYASDLYEVRRVTTATGKPRFEFQPRGGIDRPAAEGVNETMHPVGRLFGGHNEVEIYLGGDGCPPEAPLVCASEVGYSPLGAATQGHDSRPGIECLSRWMRNTEEGAFVALVPAPPGPRPLALIQDDRSEGADPNFYETHRPDRRIWRDFYYQTTYVAFERLDAVWAAGDVELAHPTGFEWSPDLITTVLEALGHLADRPKSLALKRVHLSCLHHLGSNDVLKAITVLNREQQREEPSAHRDIDLDDDFDARAFVDCAPDGTSLSRILLPR
jgi:hypothetical protein